MAHRYPNTPVTGALSQLVDQLRKSFPSTVTADTLKKLGIGPNNESYLLNVLRFVGVLDKEGSKSDTAKDVFSRHKDQEFYSGFADMIQAGYEELFDLHGDSAWALSRDDLIHFFRSADESSEIVGKRQASTFEVLAEKAGMREGGTSVPSVDNNSKGKSSRKVTAEKTSPPKVTVSKPAEPESGRARDVGLTVRVEVNLPAEGDQATYDRIFKSIRQHLIDG